MIAIDSSVLIDLLGDDGRADAAEACLRLALGQGPVVACAVVVSELTAGLGHGAEVMDALEEMGLAYSVIDQRSAVRAGEMQRKSQLAAEIARAIKARRLTQQGAAELLGVDQSKVSRITRGQFRGVSEAKLLELMTKLGHDVKIVVGPVRRRTGKIELQFA